MKKITALIILICLISSVALAAPVAVCNSELRTVDVSGTVNNSEGVVITTIIKKDENISPDNLSASVAFGELETSGSGSYNGQFLLPASADRGAFYSVYTSGDENPGEFYYATESEISSCIGAFAGVSDENIDSVLNQYVSEKNILGVSLSEDFSKYPSSSKKAMVELLDDNEPENMTEIREIFDMANEAAFLLEGNKEEVASALSQNLLGNDVDSSLSIDDLAKMYVSNRVLPNTEDDEAITETIAKNLRVATAVVSVNSATRGKMTDVLESFNDVLKLDLTGAYLTYENDVNKELTGKDFTSVELVRKAFEDKLFRLTAPSATPTPVPDFGGPGLGGVSGGDKLGTGSGVVELPAPENDAPTQVSPFKDLGTVVWAQKAINELYAQKIVSGYNEEEYKPENTVTRAEFTKLITALSGEEIKAPKNKIKVALVGDSITAGSVSKSGTVNNSITYGTYLAEMLGDRYEVKNFGKASYGIYPEHEYFYRDTDEYKNSLEFEPDIVVVMFGTNDAKNSYWNEIKSDYYKIYSDFINTYKSNNSEVKIISVVPTPVFGSSSLANERPEKNMDEMRNVIKQVCVDSGYVLVDAYTPFLEKTPEFADGVHLTAEGVKSLANVVYDTMIKSGLDIEKLFSDISYSDWFAPYVEKAVANGLVSGMGTNFVPNGNITREDAAVIIYRFLSGKTTFGNNKTFADDNSISEYAKEAVSKLAGAEIINGMGDGTFAPKATLTRAQAAVLIYSAMCALK